MKLTPRSAFGLRCLIMMCPCAHGEDDEFLWGECIICGKRVGVISRKAVRAYIERGDHLTPEAGNG